MKLILHCSLENVAMNFSYINMNFYYINIDQRTIYQDVHSMKNGY